ncbi:pectinesterase-like [Musa acuminata AAA Group]|uniref:pectinesterase-like n=1 Tax=Musa acuminata AAA Group TaxID=214697 RepID=UPI0031D4D163
MQKLPALLLFVVLLTSLPSPCLSFHDSDDIDYWCSNMPHPEPCRYYLGNNPHVGIPKDTAQFYQVSLRLAFDLTVRAQSQLKRRGPACNQARERTAWLDCWKLYDNTVLQLNRTLDAPHGACTAFDSQTWLSAALTNLQTCLTGFNDTGTSSEIIEPVTRYNVSDLISNCLAINRPAAAAATTNVSTTTDRGRVSSWMMIANRRLLQLSASADLVVAKDGSGNFRTIKEALDAAAARMQSGRLSKFVIYVKAGVYNEYVQVTSSLSNLVMLGDGIGKTIITGNRSVASGYTTLSSATFSVFGDGFKASGITFRNTFGPGSQAVALLSASDLSVYYRCSIEGYQDTLFVYSQRQFYRECDIHGTIDFIFGNAAVVLQRCNIYARRPRHGESNVITAQGRSDPNQNTGIVIQFSNIEPAAELLPVRKTVRSYLGRPWMQYSRTLFLQSYIDGIIDPAGWLPFNGNFALNTLYYGEFENTGPGSRMSKRVKWPGYHVIQRRSIVRPFTVGRFIAGRSWIPSTGVPFDPSL